MKILPHLFENNRKWASDISQSDHFFFSTLAHQQKPQFLWIGCSDSRVPANEIIGLRPGELFVHRNVANLVVHTDMNCLYVLQYAVEILKVKNILVCGHYGCSGVRTALDKSPHGLIDNWLRHIRDLQQRHVAELSEFSTVGEKTDRLCELNVIEQVTNVGNSTIVQEAWQRGQMVTIHGWIYAISNGLLKDLDVCISNIPELIKLENK
ncbi:MAG: carbonate dehydratase [Nitrospiria bacterium]